MPSMVTQTDPKMYTYILPPIRYPDGRTYLKFGQHDLTRELRTRAEVTHHYRAGPEPGHVSQLVDPARQLLPGLRGLGDRGDSATGANIWLVHTLVGDGINTNEAIRGHSFTINFQSSTTNSHSLTINRH